MVQQHYTHRSIWISDVHLGMSSSRAKDLLSFLTYNHAQYLYLVGDIFDFWQMRRRWYWPNEYDQLVEKILTDARNGTEVFYIPGNHDVELRRYIGHDVLGVKIAEDVIHITADGRKFWVIHGHQFDFVNNGIHWLSLLGDRIYSMLLRLNRIVNRLGRSMGLTYWSISASLKRCAKVTVSYLGDTERILAEEVRRREVDGVICGHNHYAEICRVGDIWYCNDGDWVESCTALVEDEQGSLQIVSL